jgi:hypothetical protein
MGIGTSQSPPPGPALSRDEQLAYEAIRARGEMGYEEFAKTMSRSIAEATSLAVTMEMKGIFVTTEGRIMMA